jgi:hypothetical protein
MLTIVRQTLLLSLSLLGSRDWFSGPPKGRIHFHRNELCLQKLSQPIPGSSGNYSESRVEEKGEKEMRRRKFGQG